MGFDEEPVAEEEEEGSDDSADEPAKGEMMKRYSSSTPSSTGTGKGTTGSSAGHLDLVEGYGKELLYRIPYAFFARIVQKKMHYFLTLNAGCCMNNAYIIQHMGNKGLS